MRRTKRPIVAIASAVALSLSASFAVPAGAQEENPADREGPTVQAEGQDVAGGLEPEPATDFDPAGHLLGDLGGPRAQLAGRGISIDPVLTLDYVKNLRGGADTNGAAFLHILNLYVTVDTEALLGLAGGSFYVDMFTQNGESPSDEAGDYALVDELDYGGRTEIAEIWYEQKFAEAFRLKVGKIDANTEFCYAENSFDFSSGQLNYAFPVTQFNFMPTAPDTAFGAVGTLSWGQAYVSGGAFDGALQEGVETGSRGPKTLFDDPADLYLAAEVGFNFEGVRPGRVALGAVHHTGDFDEFDGGTRNGNTGFYALVDAKLWKENPGDEEDEQGVGAFFVYDTADSDVSEVDQHFGGGVAWTGAVPGRDDDVAGFGAGYSHFSGGAGFLDTGEMTVEAFYKIAITDYLSVKADLQYIKDPGGAGLDDALVGLVRVQVAF